LAKILSGTNKGGKGHVEGVRGKRGGFWSTKGICVSGSHRKTRKMMKKKYSPSTEASKITRNKIRNATRKHGVESEKIGWSYEPLRPSIERGKNEGKTNVRHSTRSSAGGVKC